LIHQEIVEVLSTVTKKSINIKILTNEQTNHKKQNIEPFDMDPRTLCSNVISNN